MAAAQYRGRLVSLYQVAVTIGFLSAYIVNYYLLLYSQSDVVLKTSILHVIFVSEDDLIAVKDVIFAIGEPQYCESNITFDLDLFLKETYSFENTVPKDEYISTSFVYRLAA